MAATRILPGTASATLPISARHGLVALYGAAIALLTWHFARYLQDAWAAVRYPFELDYGEGIVWQQALLIPGARMYGDITRYPFIVFHYPPLYHLTVRAAIGLGGDGLLAGRTISLLSTLATGALAAALTHDIVRPHVSRGIALTAAAVAGLVLFLYWPVAIWSPLMRVDMLATALSFLGIWLAGRAFRRPGWLYLAVLSFVLAVYTKQTCIAAPGAVLLVGLGVDRRHTLKAYGCGLLIGLAALAVLTWASDGGFLRHILVYNLNRYSLRAAGALVLEEWPQSLFLILALGGLAAGWKAPARPPGSPPAESLLQRVRLDATARSMAVLTLYLLISTVMITTLGKSGAKLNYLIEWMCLWSVLTGILVAATLARVVSATGRWAAPPGHDKRVALALLLPAALMVAIRLMPTPRYDVDRKPGHVRQLETLVAEISDARGPVLSDDMVLLLRAGKGVPWEPAIFAELASTGRWDEHLITSMIADRAFAFILTRGQPGTELYDARYTPAVTQAIQQAYPRTGQMAGRTLHLPPAHDQAP
jgi:hypothetical protein